MTYSYVKNVKIRHLTLSKPLSLVVFCKVIIKDTSLVLTPANIKAYTLMTLQGLEYMHQHWVLHRVRAFGLIHTNTLTQKRNKYIFYFV